MRVLLYSLLVLFGLTSFSFAEDSVLVIKDHKFEPQELKVPAGKKIKITVDNQDDTPEEFESHDLSREKVISAKSKGVVFVGPLKPGSYKYVGEFHEDTAHGVIIAE